MRRCEVKERGQALGNSQKITRAHMEIDRACRGWVRAGGRTCVCACANTDFYFLFFFRY